MAGNKGAFFFGKWGKIEEGKLGNILYAFGPLCLITFPTLHLRFQYYLQIARYFTDFAVVVSAQSSGDMILTFQTTRNRMVPKKTKIQRLGERGEEV